LSRWPITEQASQPLPADPVADDGRTVLFARIQTPTGPLPFVTTQLATVNQLQTRSWVLIGAVDSAPTWEVGARRAANLPGHRWALLRGAVLANRYPKMAARRERRGVLAVTTSGRSSAILTERTDSCTRGST